MGNILVPFKKFLSNKNTITILGVLLGLVVLYFGYTWRVNQSISPQRIPYATQTLQAGTKITEDMISYTEISRDAVNNMGNIITDVNFIRNKLVAYDSKIPANGFFFSENLIDEKDMPSSVFSTIKDGYTIFALDVDNHSTYANSIMPDNTIDLYLKTTDEDTGTLVFGRFIQQIQVLAVRDSSGNDVFANKDDLREPSQLLFAVPEDLFLLLSKARFLGNFEIVPVPRNDSYSEHPGPTEITTEVLQQMIIEKTYIISGECTDIPNC